LKAENFVIDREAAKKYLFLEGKEIPYSLNILESHGDCVKELPPNTELLASSLTCPHELFVTGSRRNILACQGHPEFDFHYAVKERIWKHVVELNHRLTDEEAAQSEATFEKYTGEDALLLREYISAFLHCSSEQIVE